MAWPYPGPPSFTPALGHSLDIVSSLSSVSHSETVDGARDLEKNDTQSRVPSSLGQDTVFQVKKRLGSLGLRSDQGFFCWLLPLWSYRKVSVRRKDSRFSQKKFLESQTGFPQAAWLLLSLVLGSLSKYRFFCLLPHNSGWKTAACTAGIDRKCAVSEPWSVRY